MPGRMIAYYTYIYIYIYISIFIYVINGLLTLPRLELQIQNVTVKSFAMVFFHLISVILYYSLFFWLQERFT